MRAAHAAGACCGFDLAHAIGNVPLSLHEDDADFAAWCSYKYLNGGPGAIGGAFIHERHLRRTDLPRLAGWWGHEPATRFQMPARFDAADGAAAWALSNPPIFSTAALRASLPLFAAAGIPALRHKSLALTAWLESLLMELSSAGLTLLSPPDPAQRGCQLSWRIRGGAQRHRRVVEHLERRGVIVDWRDPTSSAWRRPHSTTASRMCCARRGSCRRRCASCPEGRHAALPVAMRALPSHTVIGAGPVGTLMALLLANRGHIVRLIERRPDPRVRAPEGGRSINLAMAARGTAALEQAGLLERLAPAMMPMPGRMLHDAHGGVQFMPYGQDERELIHALGREQLNRILIEAAAQCPEIELRFDTRCLDVEPGERSVALRDERAGRSYAESYEVLLGTDGAGSAVRTALAARGLVRAHEQPLDHDYKELAIPPQAARPARYAFEPRALHIWPRGGFMLIALPNTDGSFTATLFLPRLGAAGAPGFDRCRRPAVRAFFHAQFPDAAAVIPELTTQFAAHPQSRLGTVYCERWQSTGASCCSGMPRTPSCPSTARE